MRIDEKRYIDYGDFHIPFHDSDIKTMEAMREVPNYRMRRLSGVISMANVFADDAIEQLATEGRTANDDVEGVVKLDHFVIAEKGKPMRAEDVLAAIRKAHAEGKPATQLLHTLPNVTVQTIATPAAGVVEQANRRGRRKRSRRL
jgi:hypothetical protein